MKTVLLVEPDATIAKLIKQALKTDKIETYIAQDAQTAVTLADKNLPDLAVVELAIADQNGLAFLHEFRSYSEWKNVPIIIHTSMQLDTETALQIKKQFGCQEVLYKPKTTLGQLRRSVLEALGL